MLAIGIGFVDVWGITVDPADWIGVNMMLSQVLVIMLELGKKWSSSFSESSYSLVS